MLVFILLLRRCCFFSCWVSLFLFKLINGLFFNVFFVFDIYFCSLFKWFLRFCCWDIVEDSFFFFLLILFCKDLCLFFIFVIDFFILFVFCFILILFKFLINFLLFWIRFLSFLFCLIRLVLSFFIVVRFLVFFFGFLLRLFLWMLLSWVLIWGYIEESLFFKLLKFFFCFIKVVSFFMCLE